MFKLVRSGPVRFPPVLSGPVRSGSVRLVGFPSMCRQESLLGCGMVARSYGAIRDHFCLFLINSDHFWQSGAISGKVPQVTFCNTKIQIPRARLIVIEKGTVLRLQDGSPVILSHLGCLRRVTTVCFGCFGRFGRFLAISGRIPEVTF
jgi:hypothetical protein